MPERTRSPSPAQSRRDWTVQRLLKAHQSWCDLLLAEPSLFTVIDTYPIELLFPIREGRSQQQIGKKGKDKGRWSIGVNLCWLLDDHGHVVQCRTVTQSRMHWAVACRLHRDADCIGINWDWNTLNTHDKHFHHVDEPFIDQTIVFADFGFRSADGYPANLKLCAKGTWNERMYVETALSMVTVVCGLKRLRHRVADYITARLAYVSVMFNVLLDLSRHLDPNPKADPYRMSIAQFFL